MSLSRLTRAAAMSAVGVLAGVIVGLPSVASAQAPAPSRTLINCVQTNEINETLCEVTKVGPVGPRGQKGATGARGPIGLTGIQGPIGATGATGSTGAQGPLGPQGVVGPTGTTGSTGAAGPAAWSGVTPYNASNTYSAGPPASVVTYNNGTTTDTYVYVGSTPSSASPTATPSDWQKIAGQGVTGATGATGPQGPIGNTGPQGIQGIQGPTGPAGCSAASNGSCTVVIYGNKVGPIVAPSTSLTGSEYYSVARCPSGSTSEVYGGGGLITKNGQNSGGDVVILEGSYPGIYAGPGAEVTPVTTGAGTTGTAYEAKAVVSSLTQGDSFTLQAYAVCGP